MQEKEDVISRRNVQNDDLIYRKAALDVLHGYFDGALETDTICPKDIYNLFEIIPSAQPTLYGYNIEHLELIARVLQKEDLPPERVAEALEDIGRIVAIVKDEFEETLRKAVVNYGLSKRYW